jgi:hypothetical protein
MEIATKIASRCVFRVSLAMVVSIGPARSKMYVCFMIIRFTALTHSQRSVSPYSHAGNHEVIFRRRPGRYEYDLGRKDVAGEQAGWD